MGRTEKLLLYAAGWTLVALFFAAQSFVDASYSSRQLLWHQALVLSLADWYLWALLAPAVYALAVTAPFDSRRWPRSLAIHLPLSVLLPFAEFVAEVALLNTLKIAAGSPPVALKLALGTATYWVIVGAAHAFSYYRRYRERELRTLQLEARLAQAQLRILKMQLHPHFLFNSLNAVSALIARQPKAAEEMLAHLGDLLRLTLERSSRQLVSLQDELECVRLYLRIEEFRFRDRLRVRIDVEPEALEAQIPNLLLQPLVENAVRHGIAQRQAAGLIEIEGRIRDGSLHLGVADDGPGLGQSKSLSLSSEGIGLANTRARLKQLYGSRQSLSIENRPQGGASVRLHLPFHSAAGPDPDPSADGAGADQAEWERKAGL